MKLNDSFAAYVGSDRVRRIYKGATKVFEAPWAMDEVAAYWEMQAADAAYKTLPGNTLATAQNDGIGAVLDLKRYKERGANVVTQDGSAWTASGSSPNQWTISGNTASVDNSGGTQSCYAKHKHIVDPLTEGKLYELTFTVLSSNGVGGVCATTSTDNVTPYVTTPGVQSFLMRATGASPTQFQFRANVDWIGSIDLSTVTVREIPGYHAIQAVAANQPVLNIENGIRSALFDGVDDRLVVPNSKGAVNFLHDGTGGEFHTCVRTLSADTMYFASNGTASGNGFIFYRTGGGSLGIAIGNGSGVYAAQGSSTPGQGIQVGAINVVGFSLVGDTITFFKDAQPVGTVTASSALASGDSSGDINLGGLINSANLPLNGDMYSWVCVQGTLTDYQRQRLTTYMLRRAGA